MNDTPQPRSVPPAQTLVGHTDRVRALCFSPDAKRLASVGNDKAVCLWDVETGAGTKFSGHTYYVTSAAFSPSGAVLATAGHDHLLWLWDVVSGSGTKVAAHSGG